MKFEKLDYDETISKCIKNSFKTCREISNETGLDYEIVTRRIKQFRKDNIVFFQNSNPENYKQRGIKPMKYKLKPIYDF